MTFLITQLRIGAPAGLEEVRILGRTLNRRRADLRVPLSIPTPRTDPPKQSTD